MQGLQSKLLNYSTGLMDNPTQGMMPLKMGAINQVNKNYQNMPRKVTSQLAGRGFGNSGKLGTAMYDIEGSRMNDLSGIESQFAQMALDQQNRGASLGEQLLNAGRGTPGDSAGSALQSAGNGLGNIASMLMMSKILQNQTGKGLF